MTSDLFSPYTQAIFPIFPHPSAVPVSVQDHCEIQFTLKCVLVSLIQSLRLDFGYASYDFCPFRSIHYYVRADTKLLNCFNPHAIFSHLCHLGKLILLILALLTANQVANHLKHVVHILYISLQ